jgi:succinyl-diaminopimelate desuccinylase
MSAASAFERVAKRLDGYRDLVVDLERRLVALPALDPGSGGEGETRKAELILELLRGMGVQEIQIHNAKDDRVPSGQRPNIIARIPGQNRSRTLWLMSHMDVVPAGELKNWESDPFTLRVEGNKVFGRGAEDNGQGLVTSLALAKALMEEKVQPPIDLALLFVADEETGNDLGIRYLLDNHSIFAKDDRIVVPDGGEPDGSMIEVAEKGILWVKITVRGKQTHGSTPDRGVNAHTAAAHLICKLEGLYQRFGHKDEVFDPPTSTFEATKIEAGVPNVNTIPGEHTFYMDCRVMPNYPLEQILAAMGEAASAVDAERKTETSIEVVQRLDAAPPTKVDAPVVQGLRKAIKAVYNIEARPMGIGGGTVAAYIRRKGYAAAVWARMDETMHGPNEYAIIDNLIGDAKVFAHLLLVEG